MAKESHQVPTSIPPIPIFQKEINPAKINTELQNSASEHDNYMCQHGNKWCWDVRCTMKYMKYLDEHGLIAEYEATLKKRLLKDIPLLRLSDIPPEFGFNDID